MTLKEAVINNINEYVEELPPHVFLGQSADSVRTNIRVAYLSGMSHTLAVLQANKGSKELTVDSLLKAVNQLAVDMQLQRGDAKKK